MDDARARVYDDLRGLITGELAFEPLARSPYRRDGSLFEADPLGVVSPGSEADLVTLVRYASAQGIPIHARGAGTNPYGTAIGRGIVVDFSSRLRRILAIDESSVTVQPGAVFEEVNAQLLPLGKRIWPDPSGAWSRTIGGMIGVGASGPRSLFYGALSGSLLRARVVFSNGEAGELSSEPILETEPIAADEPFDRAVRRRLAALLKRQSPPLKGNAEIPDEEGLQHLWANGRLHLHRILDGSFGALGLMTELTLRVGPTLGGQRVLIFPFARLSDAAAAIPDCLQEGPSRCELVDWRMIRLARESDSFWERSVPSNAEGGLIVEFLGEDPDLPSSRARALVKRLSRRSARLNPVVEMSRGSDCERALNLRRTVESRLMTMKGRARPTTLIPGLSAPPHGWADLVQKLQTIFRNQDLSWTLHGCVGSGEIRVRPFLDLSSPRDRDRIGALTDAILEAAASVGGDPTRPTGHRLASPRLLDGGRSSAAMLRSLKDLFDPTDTFNPDVPAGRSLRAAPLPLRASSPRPAVAQGTLPILEPRLQWGPRGPIESAMDCNGCGSCRSFDPFMRICPSFRSSRREAESPRAMAGLIRDIATGKLAASIWGSEASRKAAEHCVHCRLCEQECPSGIDISSMMLEVKAAYAEIHGLSLSEWFISQIELWSRMASRFPAVYNRIIGSRSARWALDRLVGLAKERCLPRAAPTSFLVKAEKVGLADPAGNRSGPRVVYYLDIVANHFDHAIAEGVVAVLRHCGVQVYVPKQQRGCGMPSLVAGDVDSAREAAIANLRILGAAVREGYTIVCSEPTATLMLRREYLKLTDDLDAGLVAANTMDVGHYLLGLRSRGLLPRPQLPIHAKVGYHLPCHLRALNIGAPSIELLRQIPELEIEHIDRGCSGIAGTYGMSRSHFRASLRAGRSLRHRLKDPDLEIACSECSACRIQMEQGSRKRSFHPITLLAMSYGLLPGQMKALRDPRDRRFALG